jgi:hypothetical protein
MCQQDKYLEIIIVMASGTSRSVMRFLKHFQSEEGKFEFPFARETLWKFQSFY